MLYFYPHTFCLVISKGYKATYLPADVRRQLGLSQSQAQTLVNVIRCQADFITFMLDGLRVSRAEAAWSSNCMPLSWAFPGKINLRGVPALRRALKKTEKKLAYFYRPKPGVSGFDDECVEVLE